MLWQNKRLYLGLTFWYALLTLVLVQGFGRATDVTMVRDTLGQLLQGHLAGLATGLGVFVYMVAASGNTTNANANIYQTILIIIVSLALIWAIREVYAKRDIKVRDAFYKGMQPLVPFVLILLVIGLQLLPMVVGMLLYNLVISSGVAVFAVERVLWSLLLCLLVLLSLYMLTSSLFALYIVTLPNMTPMKALRSARGLVRYRRWTVMRKLLFLPVGMILLAALIMFPIIMWATVLAAWVFFFLTMISLALIHCYIYGLYRELLHEQATS